MAGFEPTIPASERPHTNALDYMVLGSTTKAFVLVKIQPAAENLQQLECKTEQNSGKDKESKMTIQQLRGSR